MKTVDWGKLSEPFGSDEVKWRILQSGKTAEGRVWARVASYVDRASIEDRLDQAAGPDGWSCRYERQGDAIVCTIAIRTEDGWIEKSDAAGLRDQEEQDGDPVKTAYTEAFKRAAVKWGIGRELYKREENWAVVRTDSQGTYRSKLKDGTVFSWDPPTTVREAMQDRTRSKESGQHARGLSAVSIGKPRNGVSKHIPTAQAATNTIERASSVEPTEESDEIEHLEDEIIAMLKRPPFTEEDVHTALNVIHKIHTVYGLQCYKRQWEEEYLKRVRKSK